MAEADLGLGLRTLFGFAQEPTWNGTAGAFTDPVYFSRCISINPMNETTNATDPEMTEDMDKGVYWMINEAGCEIVMNNLYEGDELFWHSLLGTYTYAQLEAGVAGSHTFKYDPTDTHDFLDGIAIGACFFDAPDTADSRWIGMNGGHVTKVVVEGNANDFLRTTWTFAGSKWKQVGAAGYTPSYPDRLPVLGVEAGNGSGQFKLGNTAVKASDFRLTLELPRAKNRYHYGSSTVAEPVRVDKLRGTIEATCELDLSTGAGWDLYLETLKPPESALTNQQLSIHHESAYDITGTASANKYRYNFNGWFQVMGDQPQVSDAGIVKFQLRGNLIDTGTGVSVQIVNGTTAQVT